MLKVPAGERIALWALASQYGINKGVYWKPPMLTKMETTNGKITLYFDSDVAPINDGMIEGFAIAGQDKQFQPAKAESLAKTAEADLNTAIK